MCPVFATRPDMGFLTPFGNIASIVGGLIYMPAKGEA
jgi:hypothetical protein